MIENWTIWNPAWVGIDIYKITQDEFTGYQAFLTICLDEGSLSENDMKVITIGTDLFGQSAAQLATFAHSRFSEIFDNVIDDISLIDGGAVLATVNIREQQERMFETVEVEDNMEYEQ